MNVFYIPYFIKQSVFTGSNSIRAQFFIAVLMAALIILDFLVFGIPVLLELIWISYDHIQLNSKLRDLFCGTKCHQSCDDSRN